MAHLYVGEPFWTARTGEITAHSGPGKYASRSLFVSAVNQWLDEHEISYQWSGESTHEHDGITDYYYHVRISNKEARTLFALRWA